MKIQSSQVAGQRVEEKMITFLMGYAPAQDLRLSDAKTIASFARNFAFNEFTRLDEEEEPRP